MSEPWTPGPWQVEDDSGTAFDAWWVAGPSWVFDGNNNVGIENPADACLIALAPEMALLLSREIASEPTGPDAECVFCGADSLSFQLHDGDCAVVSARRLLVRARGEAVAR